MVFLYKTDTYSGDIQSSLEVEIFWHLDMMLEIFEGNGVTELYFDRNDSESNPLFK